MYLNDKYFNNFRKQLSKSDLESFSKGEKNLLKYIPNIIPWNKYNKLIIC